MACTPCQKRRKALLEAKRQKKAEGKRLQEAALGAVLSVSEAVGKALNINGEVENEQDRTRPGSEPPIEPD
jgi:hypothetical protein